MWIESDPDSEAAGLLRTAQRLAPRLGRPGGRVEVRTPAEDAPGAGGTQTKSAQASASESSEQETGAGAQVREYAEAKQALIVFRKSMADHAKVREHAGAQLPIVFFVDELDRCRPAYAIRVLERIKHLFAVPGISFVIGMNREQLGHAIKAV